MPNSLAYCQDWVKVSDDGPADTLFVRYDSTSIYMPIKFDNVYEDGSIENRFHKLFDAKRDHNTIGILFYYKDMLNDFSNGLSYIKVQISRDSAWVLNNGRYSSFYSRSTGAVGKGARQVRLIDASTVVVPHQDPMITVIDHYSDDATVYRYTCDTTLTKKGRAKPWQRYPWPPPGNYHEDK